MFDLFLALAVMAPDTAEVPKTTAEAIAIADAHPGRGTTGVYRMTIAAGTRTPNVTFLNTATDYLAPDDLTVQFRAITAKALANRLGASPEVALIGRTITIRGTIRAIPIADTVGGRTRRLNRYQHMIVVQDENQITVDQPPAK